MLRLQVKPIASPENTNADFPKKFRRLRN
ncbi:hypothetical protein MESS2_1480020 [Mesorhizobium metallidurans STM 2683]|uniref:Uncharacterized protein n=1 Tax=Mesorhizobium metallidurans STM 2683 TaxID=1297569 RepID=M5EJR4_9HYPH|nr:hypothetical protein MESS2_1480020 [Mesorhizobium metallidurans STM 2683]